ncbi:uncharacterized protein LOC131995878 [Stomoxys calcitrans]|uniref:uncharacterized protein LOC131995878 n=1 Tax=Stomoxys calcitrans TaxID=35570 RepID=UPI0027E2D13C|nr:uncharacterized protein LOC131995878 [Stomoxys calcitrans]
MLACIECLSTTNFCFVSLRFKIYCCRYKFVAAKCMEYNTNHQVDGPVKICTFPPKHGVSQEEINAVIQHIKTLN